ncbi:MAG: DEAD/DEAH box helicase [Fretibacterium sp.]|nr:DEAD/DEAH box helicase [Fretibacterium sp.]
MLFDERERARLLELYTALPEELKRFCRLMSVARVPVGMTNFVHCLNEACVCRPGGGNWYLAHFKEAVKALPGDILCEQSIGQYKQYQISPLLTAPLWKEAEERKEIDRFDRATSNVLGLETLSLTGRGSSLEDLFSRMLRLAVLRRDPDSFNSYWHRGQTVCAGFTDAALDALANPFEPEAIFQLPPELAEPIFTVLLHAALTDPETYQKVTETLFEYPAEEATPGLELMLIERLIEHGRLDEAEERLKHFDDPQGFSLRAVLALSRRGDEAEALSLYDEGFKRMKTAREENGDVFYRSWTGLFYPVLLVKAGREGSQIKASLKESAYWGTVEDISHLRLLLGQLLNVSKDEGFRIHLDFFEDGTAVFPCLLLLRWLNADLSGMDIHALTLILKKRGLDFLCSELAAAFELEGGEAVSHPLAAVFSQKEEWEQSLDELLSIGGKPRSQGNPKRVIWELGWYAGKDGNVLSLDLAPVEQTFKKRGWSGGRHISLRRLYKNAHAVPGITEQDIQVLPAIRVMRNYYGTDYFLDTHRALALLAGHPLLFNSDTGERVEVQAVEPILSVQDQERGYVLTLSPFPEENERYLVVEEGPNRLRVTSFDERRLHIAHILGPSGLLIPAQAKESILRTLESLASVITIQSDLEGTGGLAEAVEPDSRIYVQLQPNGEGLDIGVVTRPLGPQGPVCRPGQGGAALFGLQDKRRVRASRDLEAENAALAALLEGCPALSEAEQVREEGWQISGPYLALEFLAQLKELEETVVVEWPKGQSMKVSRPTGESQLNISIRQARDWFAVSGELRVHEGLVLSMKELLEAMKAGKGRFVPLGNGEFLALTQEFHRRLEVLASLGDVRGDEVRISPLAASVTGELLEGVGQADVAEEWRSKALQIAEAEQMTPVLPSTFRGELRDYQLEGFRWLMRLAHWGAGACLADDMGLGKTIQALAVLVARGAEGPSLVVAPTSVCPNWTAEAARFAPTLNVKSLRETGPGRTGREELLSQLEPRDVVIVSYGILQNERDILSGVEWNVIVLDEAQAIKNMGTKRSSAVMKLNGAFRIATTGTPIENSLSELWNLFRFLNPGYLGSFESFWRRFGVPIERSGAEGRASQPAEGLVTAVPDRRPGREARSRLRRMIRPFVLRRTKEQVLSELPPKTEITLKVDLKDEERAFYEALRRSAVEELSEVREEGEGGRFQVLAALMKLRRACCSASLVSPDIHLPSAKLEAFTDVLTELRGGGHKALVFSQFVDHLSILRAWLDKEKIPYQYLDGSTPQEERERRVAAFQAGEGDCFLISLRAGGTGLNLTAADYVVHMDPWWNPAVEAQASDRAHRIGQTRPVTVYRIVARDTIEEQIVALHAWKRDLAGGLLDDTGEALRLSVKELLELIES